MKAIFIDGPSVHYMGHAMGIARFNLAELNRVLSEEVGSKQPLAHPIVVTVTPAMGKGVAGLYRKAGFEVLEVSSTDSADDLAIIARMSALDPQKVTEVILVTTDQDYVSVLRQKVAQGMKVTWVGYSDNGPNGTPLMSTSLKPLLGSEFDFVDLPKFKDQVMGLPKKMPPANKLNTPTRSLTIELHGARSHDEYMDIVAQLLRTLRKSPHIKYKIEG